MIDTRLLPYGFARDFSLLARSGDKPGGAVEVLMSDATPPSAIAEVSRRFGSVKLKHMPRAELEEAIAKAYASAGGDAAQVIDEVESDFDLTRLMQDMPAIEDLLESSDDAPVIRMINALLTQALREGASDIHIEPFEQVSVVRFRIAGALRDIVRPRKAIHASLISRIKIMAQLDIAEKRLPQDGRITLRIGGRPVDVRVSTLPTGHGERAVLRLLDKEAGRLDLSHLGMSGEMQHEFENLIHQPHGIVLVTGPTGSGKSTTLATMVDKINRERAEHIITIEDPIEFVHQHKKCVVNQRELYADTRSFKSALKSVLREDPDKVLVGEMRDLETIEAALTIAETGHLTFATLHTNSAVQTINRIIDVFPPHQQPQVRAQLSFTLEAVMCQMLLPRANGQGRVMVLEIMIPTAAIRNLIREDQLHQVYSMMQAGKERSGMQTMNESLMQHYLRRSITMEQALSASTMPEELTQMIHRTPGQAARR